jgi:hypothetical protein
MTNTLTFTNGTGSKRRRALDYLMAGRGLTSNEARSRFGIQNFRATISDIKEQVERYGNWRIVTEETSNGTNRYFIRRVLLVDPATA